VIIKYDAFEHLCRSLFKSGEDVFGMIVGYFDESGTSAKEPAIGVAGYFGSCSQWDKFNVEWRNMLSEFGLSEFHRTDIESRHLYVPGWTTKDRNRVVIQAQKIIKEFTYIGVGNAVIKADFEDVFPPVLKKYYGGPYGYCAFLCVARAKHWHENIKNKDGINWVFEAGAQGVEQFNILMKALYSDLELRQAFRVGTWSFAGKDILPLQAADTIAYELNKFVHGQIIENRGKPRLSFEDLIRDKDNDYLEFWPRGRLQEYVETEGIKTLVQTLTDHDHRFLDYLVRRKT
jgi:hypothetical protein